MVLVFFSNVNALANTKGCCDSRSGEVRVKSKYIKEYEILVEKVSLPYDLLFQADAESLFIAWQDYAEAGRVVSA